MGIHKIPLVDPHQSEDVEFADYVSQSSEDDDDDNWEDWNSDPQTQTRCFSLFDDCDFKSASEALAYDKDKFSFDLEAICKHLSLDFYGRTRLINFIRKEKPKSSELQNISGKEAFFTSNVYLKPEIEDDPLIQYGMNSWSDDDEGETAKSQVDVSREGQNRIQLLEKKLLQALQELSSYRRLVEDRLGFSELDIADEEPEQAETSLKAKTKARDDDTHYFDSYDEHEIHAVMIQDKVRTATYASFIFSNPSLFQDAVVLDVGCGTGILSLFAARAGARRVIAVDASDIAEKAEKIVRDNDLEDVITVIRGKVEEIQLPDDIDHVDIIVSEWMGYALLYESMLDSVLSARNRFLKPEGGVMVPSQCQMMLSLCSASEIYKERVQFWSDVYGFDLTAMAEDIYDDAIVDVVGPENLLSEPVVVKDLYLGGISSKQLDFTSSFKLTCDSPRRTTMHAFLLYFDTFFTADGNPIPSERSVRVIKDEDAILAEVWRVGGDQKPRRSLSRSLSRRASEKKSADAEKQRKEKEIMSFSTGPQSVPTHWKQTLFLLREPIVLEEGTTISGTISCRKNDENSRELDIELRYAVELVDKEDNITIVQTYKVR